MDALFLQAIGASYRATAFEEAFSYRWHAASASTTAALGELFGGLERYGRLLADQREHNPALAEVLRRYFARYAAHIGWHWRQEALMAAYRARTRLDPCLDQRVTALASLFGEIPPLPTRPRKLSARLLEGATRSSFVWALYRVWRAQQKGRAAASRWLSVGSRRQAVGKP